MLARKRVKKTDFVIIIILMLIILTVVLYNIFCVERIKNTYLYANDHMKTVINDIQTGDAEKYENNVAFFNQELEEKNNVILLGDSYGINYLRIFNIGWIGWIEQFKTMFPECKCYTSAIPGSGLYVMEKGFETQLDDIIVNNPDLKDVSEIILVGGYNDVMNDVKHNSQTTSEQIDNAMADFVIKAHEKWPDVKISYMYVARDLDNSNDDYLVGFSENFKDICDKNNVLYVDGSNDILNCSDDMYVNDEDPNSGFHPSTRGSKKIAISIAEYLVNGKLEE